MTEELLINVTDFETRVALTAGGALQEVHLARAEGYSLTGNIYLGRVERIVPGMQAAFVNIGLERPGFLHVRDIEGPRLMQGEPEEGPPDIRDLLHEGQQLMVQVAKDPIASKGARLTAALAIASRYVVLMPFNEHIGVSQRIEDEVERIVPGMQAAFVNIGLERPGFLHVRDIEGPRLMQGEPEEGPPDIRDLLHEGQQLMVQVAKDPIASKGARLTAALAIASRYVVLMPFNEHIGVSQRIEDEVERERLRRDVEEIRGLHGLRLGFILRTAAEGVARAVLDTDMRVLARLWEKVLEKKRQVGCPSVVYQEIPLHIRVMRDLAGPRVEHIRIDHVETYQRVLDFVRDFLPEFIERVHLYQDRRPLFERYGIEDELTRALASRVPLKSGGHIVIEQTEAMITVDVNTGGFLGVASLEETVFRTNLEAAQVIPRQLRLRNLGGIIVIDFIDMEDEDHRRQVLRTLERACEGDPARVRFDGFSSLGLVLMSRKRTRESLIQQLCEPCPACAGTGFVKTAQSTCIEVFRAILQDARGRREVDARSSVASPMEYLIRACDAVVDRLLDEDADQLQALSREIGRAVRLQVEPSYGAGQFDIVLVQDMRRSG